MKQVLTYDKLSKLIGEVMYKNKDEMTTKKRCYVISDAYTLYDLKIIDIYSFKGIVAMMLAGEDDAFIGHLSVKKYKGSKQWKLYRKLNKRLPFSRSSKEIGLTRDNICDNCNLMHHSINRHKSNFCPNQKNHGDTNLISNIKLYDFLKSDLEDELLIATGRSIQRMLYLNGNKTI